MNKKASNAFMYVVIMFSMLTMMTMFSTIFLYEIGSTEILDPILNATLEVEQTLNVSTQLQNHAVDVKAQYDAIDIPYDLFFLYLWVGSFASSIILALRAKKESVFSFFGSLFFSIMGLLLIVFFVDQVQTWFFANIFNAVFSDIVLNLPIMDYYFENIGVISALWFIILLLIRFIDLDIRVGRRAQQ